MLEKSYYIAEISLQHETLKQKHKSHLRDSLLRTQLRVYSFYSHQTKFIIMTHNTVTSKDNCKDTLGFGWYSSQLHTQTKVCKNMSALLPYTQNLLWLSCSASA